MTILDGDVTKGWIRERRVLKLLFPRSSSEEREGRIPKMALRYAEKVSERTGIPVEEVMRSKPFRNFLRRLTE